MQQLLPDINGQYNTCHKLCLLAIMDIRWKRREKLMGTFPTSKEATTYNSNLLLFRRIVNWLLFHESWTTESLVCKKSTNFTLGHPFYIFWEYYRRGSLRCFYSIGWRNSATVRKQKGVEFVNIVRSFSSSKKFLTSQELRVIHSCVQGHHILRYEP